MSILVAASNSKVYGNNYSKVFEAVKNSLKDCNFKLKEEDKEKGEIRASTSMSIMSWGESIHISIAKVSENKTKVSIYSKVRFQVLSWGKNEENISQLFTALDKRLSK